MKTRLYGIRFIGVVAAISVALAMGGPVAQAGSPPIMMDTSSPATDCGSYSGQTAKTTLALALSGVTTGTVVICPGSYLASGGVTVTGANKLTIKQAVPGLENRPHLVVQTPTVFGLRLMNSTAVTVDGLYLDGWNGGPAYTSVRFDNSSGTVRNSVLQGNDLLASGVWAVNSGTTQLKLAVSNNLIAGYAVGVYAGGPIKITVSGNTFDGSDGGRLATSSPTGVWFAGDSIASTLLTGTVSKNMLMNNAKGIEIENASKVSVTGNTLFNNFIGVEVLADSFGTAADNNKITSNTILGVQDSGYGIWLNAADTGIPLATMHGTSISKNRIASATFNDTSSLTVGIALGQTNATPGLITAAISGNTFNGFMLLPSSRFIYYISMGPIVTRSNNAHTP